MKNTGMPLQQLGATMFIWPPPNRREFISMPPGVGIWQTETTENGSP
jgi:hypothetical protein